MCLTATGKSRGGPPGLSRLQGAGAREWAPQLGHLASATRCAICSSSCSIRAKKFARITVDTQVVVAADVEVLVDGVRGDDLHERSPSGCMGRPGGGVLTAAPRL